MKNSMAPEIRFAGFSEDWEERKLDDVADEVVGNDGRTELPVLTISAANGWMKQEDRFSKVIAGNELKNYTLLKEGELSYNHGNSKLAKYGAVFELRNCEEALVPKVYHSFKTNASANSSFLEYKFFSKIPDRELSKLISSGARMDGLLNISKNAFFGIKILIPNKEEQTQIGHFFKQLDDTIAIHQNELDNLKQTKQGFLQKMFPKEGQSVPEIRFNGFSAEWEEQKLSQLVEERNEQISESEKYKLMSFTATDGVTPKSDRYNREFLVKSDNKKYKKTEKGDLIYSSNNLDVGSIGLNRLGNAVISPVYSIFSPKKGVVSEFMGTIVKHKEFINKMLRYRQGVVYGQWRIHESEFLNIKTLIPSIEEQTQIGNFFKQLDDTITLKERELDLLKQTKKAFLQKMFI